MTTLTYDMDLKAPVEEIYNFMTDIDSVKSAWSPDIVKEATVISGNKGEKGSVIKLLGHYGGKDEEMRLLVVDRTPNSRYASKQTEGPFKQWESVSEFRSKDNNTTHVKYSINYELPTTGKIFRMVTNRDADDKLRKGVEDYIQNLRQKFQSS